MNHATRGILTLPLLALAACNSSPDNRALAKAESQATRDAAEDGRIDCALEGAKNFDRTCTVEEVNGPEGIVLIIGRANTGYRRLQITGDGRGVVSADGSEPATVTVIDDGVIEVVIGADRYRLPANTGGVK